MIRNCTLYFPTAKPPFKSLFPKGRSDGGFFKAATWFEYDAGEGPIRLTFDHPDLAQHLRGFKGYVAQLPDDGAARAKAQALIDTTQACAGVVLPKPVQRDSRTFAALLERFDGFMFVSDSILLADGRFLVGPMAEPEVPEVDSATPLEPAGDCSHQRPNEDADPARVAIREQHYRMLAERGFKCARWLPLHRSDDGKDTLRPLPEIASRLLALQALFLWVSAPEDFAASDRLVAFLDRNALRAHLTDRERAMLSLPRSDANAQHANTIGWRLENMWALSWIVGFDPAPSFDTGQLPDDLITRMLIEFLPHLEGTAGAFLESVRARTPEDVGRMEDLFYCTHNAVRSAQTGKATVPQQFHPVRDGGAIHERRHALTWAMSPGTGWDETDLST